MQMNRGGKISAEVTYTFRMSSKEERARKIFCLLYASFQFPKKLK